MDYDEKYKLFQYLAWLTGITVLIFTALSFYFKNKAKEEDQLKSPLSGQLNTGNVNAENRLFAGKKESMLKDGLVTVYLGSLNSYVKLPSSNFHDGVDATQIILINDKYPFIIKYKDNRIFVTIRVANFKLEKVAEITDNEWVVEPGMYLKRNYDNNAFEVTDENGLVLLQIDFFDKNKILISGIFLSEDGFMSLNENGMIFKAKFTESDYKEQASSITPIFKYTGDNFLGKRIKRRLGLLKKISFAYGCCSFTNHSPNSPSGACL